MDESSWHRQRETNVRGSCRPVRGREWRNGRLFEFIECARDITILCETARKVSGHDCRITAYEGAKGELLFKVVIPALGEDTYKCAVTFADLKLLYEIGDPQLEKPIIETLGGKTHADDGEQDSLVDVTRSTISQVLDTVLDRLVIHPTALTFVDGDPNFGR